MQQISYFGFFLLVWLKRFFFRCFFRQFVRAKFAALVKTKKIGEVSKFLLKNRQIDSINKIIDKKRTFLSESLFLSKNHIKFFNHFKKTRKKNQKNSKDVMHFSISHFNDSSETSSVPPFFRVVGLCWGDGTPDDPSQLILVLQPEHGVQLLLGRWQSQTLLHEEVKEC